jgi:hypothetical protein
MAEADRESANPALLGHESGYLNTLANSIVNDSAIVSTSNILSPVFQAIAKSVVDFSKDLGDWEQQNRPEVRGVTHLFSQA